MEVERKYIYRIDPDAGQKGARSKGWQVRLDRKINYLSKLFSDSKYGGKEKALEAAIKFRDKALKDRHESLHSHGAGARLILSSLPKNNTSGILGVSRSISTEKNGARFPYWQTAFRGPNKKTKVKSFRVNKYGELGALILAVEARRDGMMELFVNAEADDLAEGFVELIEEYEKIISFLKSLDKNDADSLIEFLSSLEVSPTSKKEMLERRIAQHIFRTKIYEEWDGKCAACGASAFVIASHIKPWAVSSDKERTDKYNGLCLSPNYDKAFDLGFITFNSEGTIVCFPGFQEQATLLNISLDIVLDRYTPFHDKYMKYHREHVYKGKDF